MSTVRGCSPELFLHCRGKRTFNTDCLEKHDSCNRKTDGKMITLRFPFERIRSSSDVNEGLISEEISWHLHSVWLYNDFMNPNYEETQEIHPSQIYFLTGLIIWVSSSSVQWLLWCLPAMSFFSLPTQLPSHTAPGHAAHQPGSCCTNLHSTSQRRPQWHSWALLSGWCCSSCRY